MKLKNVFALGVLGLLTLGVGVGLTTAANVATYDGTAVIAATTPTYSMGHKETEFDPAFPTTNQSTLCENIHKATKIGLASKNVYNNGSGYLMFKEALGYLYSTTELPGLEKVVLTYTGGTSKSGKIAVGFGTSAIPDRITSGHALVTKGGSQTFNATAGSKYFQISSSSKNVQIATIDIYCGAVGPSVTLTANIEGQVGDPNKTLTATLNDFTETDLLYDWSLPTNQNCVEIVGATDTDTVELKYLNAGETDLTFAVVGNNETAEATCHIKVNPAPVPEISLSPASITAELNVSSNTIVTPTLSHFKDTVLTYDWSLGKTDVAQLVSAPDAKTAELKFIGVGTDTLTLTVMGDNDIAEATLSINVKPETPAISITEMKAKNTGNTVYKVEGVVASTLGKHDAYICDPTNGVGLQIHDPTDDNLLTVGNKVKFDAVLGEFRGTKQLNKVTNVTLIDTNISVTPQVVTPSQIKAEDKGNLIQIKGLVYKSNFTSASSSATFAQREGSNQTFDVYAGSNVTHIIDVVIANLNTFKSNETTINITGIAGYHSNNGQITLTDDTKFEKVYDEFIEALDMTSNVEGQCNSKFQPAKDLFFKLTVKERETFKTASDADTVAARNRYEAWARALNQDPYTEGTQSNLIDGMENNVAIITIVAISALAVSTIAIFVIVRKRKDA